ncbi:MAG: ABC transporter ATP-binding protein [Planctomycetota bacterium]|nr:ABC transporter ATP-binding protein [Planctomycetota bacterium]
MTLSIDQVVWPAKSLGDALLTLAKFAKLPHQTVRWVATPDMSLGDCEKVHCSGECGHETTSGHFSYERWLEAAAERIGLEVESVATPYSDVESLLGHVSPALIAVPGTQLQFAVVLGARRRHLHVIAPDLSIVRVTIEELRTAMCRKAVAPHLQPIEHLLKEVGLSGRAGNKAGRALLAKRMADEQIGGCWQLRAPGRGDVRWGRWLTAMIGTHIIEQCCSLSAWSLLGWMTFSGRLDGGWLWAWLLLLACVIPFRVLSLAAGGQLSLEFSSSLRRRLLAGALRLDPDRVRVEGTGGLLGRVMEAEALEQLALGGGLQSALSVVELFLAATVLGSAASQWGGAMLLGAFVVLAMWLTVLNVRRREAWTDARLGLTNDLVERMIGHRTTLAQETRDQAAAETDQSLELYLEPSNRLDRSTIVLQSVLPRIWLLCGLLWLAPAFVSGSDSVTRLAVSLGGLLLAKQGLQSLVQGLERISGATVAWRRLQPFLAKPDHPEPVGEPDLVASRRCSNRTRTTQAKPNPEAPLANSSSASFGRDFLTHVPSKWVANDDIILESKSVTFRHANRSEPVLRGVDLLIRQNDRVLLEGPSGGGKSTLAMLLSGVRTPQAGVLLLHGLDRQTLGVAWRRRVVLAPQFHHNHVLMGTFLYNLLLGRAWPPAKADAEAAEQLCRKLDLGPLIDRMPGGLLQMVGETGWQLSHGEKSRLFLARALLQQADVVLLDETFSALDPQTLLHTLPKVLELAPTLVVIAHP